MMPKVYKVHLGSTKDRIQNMYFSESWMWGWGEGRGGGSGIRVKQNNSNIWGPRMWVEQTYISFNSAEVYFCLQQGIKTINIRRTFIFMLLNRLDFKSVSTRGHIESIYFLLLLNNIK